MGPSTFITEGGGLMIPARIELFIDRLCSFWPTTNIARNTLKSGWTHSEVMIAATDEEGRKVLDFCKGLPQFPSLAQVEHMFKKEMGYGSQQVGCPECDYNLWVQAEDMIWMGYKYSQVRRCKCAAPLGRSLRGSAGSTSGSNGQDGDAGSKSNGISIAEMF
jgi:hypothetical protein